MRLFHDSRDERFRTPFGAVPVGTEVALAIEVRDADPAAVRAQVRLWVDGEGERFVAMEPDPEGPGRFTATLPCPTPQLLWYSFVAAVPGQTAWLGARAGAVGGPGAQYDHADPPSFQITVYEPRADEPLWYTRGLVYQIFPDRYRRDEAWRERAQAALAARRTGVPRALLEDWDTPPAYERTAEGAIARWDFHGGSLQGIREDLPRLKEWGVTAIYLNPIFEAASNHRYDTGDYLRIDPILGTESDFCALCADAETLGIGIIIDGVFNHTGVDSRYFNKYATYSDFGAWQGECSPWHDAFTFRPDGTYECWWGVDDLPSFRKDAPQVRELLLGEDGVVRRWLRAGARGWRLDVADELTDELIEKVRAEALAERPDAVVLGEVWEDASHKISYGRLRRYLLGDELDGAMNYPLRRAVLDFLMGRQDAGASAEAIAALRENYPPQALRASLNLLGSHDRPRLLTELGGLPDTSAMTPAERGAWRLEGDRLALAKRRFWLAVLMQMTLPGVPTIYYGDEAGAQGLADPHNRAPYPWDAEDRDAMTMMRNAVELRRALPLFVDGDVRAWAPCDDVLAFDRAGVLGETPALAAAPTPCDPRQPGDPRHPERSEGSPDPAFADLPGRSFADAQDDGKRPRNGKPAFAATVLANRSATERHTVRVPLLGEVGCEFVEGGELTDEGDGRASVHLGPLGSAVACFGPRTRLQKPLEPGVGVLCHLTSLPTDNGRPGHLGEPAFRFVDALAQAGVRYWQVLPVNPTDAYRSPYAGPSAFAGNVDLLGTPRRELGEAYERERAGAGRSFDQDACAWFASQSSWLAPYCAFMALRELHGGAARQTWEPEFARYDRALLDDPRIAERARFHAWCQWRFERAWRKLLAYAHDRGIKIIGDVPYYVSADSADAWAAPELFSLDARGGIAEEAGYPPDPFSEEGQRWGSPTYRWDAMERDGYGWWIMRLGRALGLYDFTRLDHFLGYQSYYGIAAGQTPLNGTWHHGPGLSLFERARRELGPLPLIAEDLGNLTPATRALAFACGFPGLDVLQFRDGDVREGIRPRTDKLLLTGTHDTDTLVGWCAGRFCEGDEAAGRTLAERLLRDALASGAPVVIVPLQDAALLGGAARMNTPGTAQANWSWQATHEDVKKGMEKLAYLMRETGRLG